MFLIEFASNPGGKRPGDLETSFEDIPYWVCFKSLKKGTKRSSEDLKIFLVGFASLRKETGRSRHDFEDIVLSRNEAQLEADKRGLYLLPDPPEGTGRGWLMNQLKNNPKAITILKLQEILRKEKFRNRTSTIKRSTR